MPENAWSCALLMLAGIFLSSVSQAMLKKSAMKPHGSRLREYLNPLVITAYVIYFGTTLSCVAAYKGLPLSVGTALQSAGYVFVTFFGVRLFGERLTLRRVFSLCLIVGGILVYALLG